MNKDVAGNKFVSWNPVDSSKYLCFGAKLELCEVQSYEREYRSARVLFSKDFQKITCAEWNFERPTVAACATALGNLNIIDWGNNFETESIIPIKFAKKSISAISWNKQQSSQLAVGFDSYNKSDYNVSIFDFGNEKLVKVAYGEIITALNWMPDNQNLLAVGNSTGWFRLYDIRLGSKQAAISFLAHPSQRTRKVKGIRSDPFNHHVFCTFSDGPGDSVKVWDIRRVLTMSTTTPSNSSNNNNKTQAFLVHPNSAPTNPATVMDVAWSPDKVGLLGLTTNIQPSLISFFQVNKHYYTFDNSNDDNSNNSSNSSIDVSHTRTPLFVQAAATESSLYANSNSNNSMMIIRSLSIQGIEQRMKETYQAHGNILDAYVYLGGVGSSSNIDTTHTHTHGFFSSSRNDYDSNNGAVAWESFKTDEAVQSLTMSKLLFAKPFKQFQFNLRDDSNINSVSNSINRRRVLGAVTEGVVDVEVIVSAPLAVSLSGLLCRSAAVSKDNSNNNILLLSKHSVNTNLLSTSKSSVVTNNTIDIEHAILTQDHYNTQIEFLLQSSDIMARMKSRCVAGYSINESNNCDVLSAEIDKVYSKLHRMSGFAYNDSAVVRHAITTINVTQEQKEYHIIQQFLELVKMIQSLYRVWVWIDRFEAIANQTNLTLKNCGMIDIILSEMTSSSNSNNNSNPSININSSVNNNNAYLLSAFNPRLGTVMYVSKNRYLCKRICGWIGIIGWTEDDDNNDDMLSSNNSTPNINIRSSTPYTNSATSSIVPLQSASSFHEIAFEGNKEEGLLEMMASESQESFERVAAMCLFHGDIDLAVRVLFKAIKTFERYSSRVSSQLPGTSSIIYRPSPRPHHKNKSNSNKNATIAPESPGSYFNEAIIDADNTAEAGRHQRNRGRHNNVDDNEDAGSINNGDDDNYIDDMENEEEGSIDNTKVTWDVTITSEYMQLVSLVGMCMAGYNYSNNVNSNNTSSSWVSMCKLVLDRLRTSNRHATHYLSAICIFLLSNLNEYTPTTSSSSHEINININSRVIVKVGYREIVNNPHLTLEDRVAFAATYLSSEALMEWFTRIRDESLEYGQIEALILTGLSKDGIDILQSYVNHYDDLQSTALIVSRIIDDNINTSYSSDSNRNSGNYSSNRQSSTPTNSNNSNYNSSSSNNNNNKEWIWLNEYRQLLNKWEMFIERAKLDVALGKRYQIKSDIKSINELRSNNSVSNNLGGMLMNKTGVNSYMSKAKGGTGYGSSMGGGGAGGGGKTPHNADRSKRLLYKIPPHSELPYIYLRCNYCGTSLPIDGMQISNNVNKVDTLRNQKSIMNCCAGCYKQLPRCYVCQLYMGMINPYLELNRKMTQKRLMNDNALLGLSNNNNSSINDINGELGNATSITPKNHNSNNNIANNNTSNNTAAVDHNVLDFGRWFFFCQHCRHGGHAYCIDEWFGGVIECSTNSSGSAADNTLLNSKPNKRIVCGVNGCQCNCKLKR